MTVAHETYELERIELDEAGLAAARALLVDPESAWYARRRLAALAAAGLSDFETLHPRGHDGRFIEKFGFVRWLLNGKWERGQVQNIGKGGVIVKPDRFEVNDGKNFILQPDTLYSLPKPKAKLNLPSPKDTVTPAGWVKVGGQGGSNPGGLYEVIKDIPPELPEEFAGDVDLPKSGDKYYIKNAKSSTHAREEALANQLYEMAGVPVPDVAVGDDGVTVSSKIVDTPNTISLEQGLKDPAIKARVQEDMVVDAWLANWDVAGLVLDNIKVVDGVPFRVDAGGALSYRAQGGAKGDKFGTVVGEIDTLRNKSLNPAAAKVFGDTTDEQMRAGAKRIAAISPQEIKDAVVSGGLPLDLASKLIARRKDILTRLHVDDPNEPAMPAKTTIPTGSGIANMKPIEDVAKLDLAHAAYDTTIHTWVGGDATPTRLARELYDSHLATWPKTDITSLIDAGVKTAYVRYDDRVWEFIPATEENHLPEAQFRDVTTDVTTFPASVVLPNNPTFLVANDERLAKHKALHSQLLNSSVSERAKKESLDVLVEDVAVGYGYADSENKQPTSLSFRDSPPSYVKDNYLVPDGNWPVYGVIGEETTGETGGYDVKTFYGRVTDFNESTITLTNAGGETRTISRSSDGLIESISLSRNEYSGELLAAMDQLAQLQKEQADLEEGSVPSVQPSGVDLDVPDVTPEPPDPKTELSEKKPGVAPPPATKKDAPHYPPIEGISADLPVAGETIVLSEVIGGLSGPALEKAVEELKAELVGKSVITHQGKSGTLNADGYVDASQGVGLFQITDVTMAGGTGQVNISFISSSGASRTLRAYAGNNVSASSWRITPVGVDVVPTPAATMKKDGSLVYGGEVVGSWSKKGWGYSQYNITVDAEHSVFGAKTKFATYNQRDAKRMIGHNVLPKKQVVAIAKPASAVAHEQSVLTGPSAGKLLGGDEARVGQWVMSSKDGMVGKIVGFPNLEKYPNDVWVLTPDGAKRSRKITKLKGIPNPNAVEQDIPFNETKLADGTPVAIGMRLKVGTAGKEVDGVVVKSNADGYVQIKDDATGKKVWRKASTGKLLEAAGGPPPTVVGAEAAKPGKSYGAVKYPADDGSVTPQSVAFKEDWVKQGRLLTKDGYAPQVGMHVRDAKGNLLIVEKVKSPYEASPNSIRAYNVRTGDLVWRAVNNVHVDHAAELATADGKPAPHVKSITFNGHEFHVPEGSVVYKMRVKDWLYREGGGNQFEADRYFVSEPTTGTNTNVWELVSYPYAGSPDYKRIVSIGDKLQMFHSDSKLERVAVVDPEASDGFAALYNKGNGKTKVAVYDVATEDAASAINKIEAAELAAKAAQTGGAPPKSVNEASIKPLPKPPVPIDTASLYPELPQVTGELGNLADAPRIEGARSVVDAAWHAVEQRATKAPGSSTFYGLGDTDYVEDMLVRSQVVVDESGQQFVEMRFALLEDKIDALSQKLLVATDGEKGAWQRSYAHPQDLLDGDKIAVRRSSVDGSLKPAASNSSVPNATVTGSPTLIGTSNGMDLYRVQVTFSNGTIGEVDMEKRVDASISLFTFDPNAIVPGTGKVQLSPRAADEGWSVAHDGLAYQSGNPSIKTGSVYLDDTGVFHTIDTYKSVQSSGFRLRRSIDGDQSKGSVELNVAPVEAGGRDKLGYYSTGQRTTINGNVTIRVPVPVDASDKGQLDVESISRMFEMVGVPPSAQGPATPEQLHAYAMNKVYRQYAPTYHHQERPNLATPDDTAVLDLVDKAVGKTLGRKVTPDDVKFRIWNTGRVSVAMSDDVAKALSEQQGIRSYSHQLYSRSDLKNILFGTGNGLMSSDERWSTGVFASGMSPGPDQQNDAGNRVYLRAQKGSSVSGGHIYFAPRVLNSSTEHYWNNHDAFGKRPEKNLGWTQMGSINGSNELMYKRRLEPDQIGYVVVDSSSEREQYLKMMKDNGMTHLGGRPIEDVVVVYGSVTVPADWDAAVGQGHVDVPLSRVTSGGVPVAAAP